MNKFPVSKVVRSTITPFLRLSAQLGWPFGPAESRLGVPYLDGPITLAIEGQSAISLNEPFGSFGGRTLPKGVAISSAGRIFVADPKRRELLTALSHTLDAENTSTQGQLQPFKPLWPARPLVKDEAQLCVAEFASEPATADPYRLLEPIDVAVSASGDLAILDRQTRRVLILAFPSARLRRIIEIDRGTPEAIAYDGDGRLYLILSEPGAIHRYDRFGRKDSQFSQVTLTRPTALAAARLHSDVEESSCQPLRADGAVIHVLDDGKLLSLDAKGNTVSTTESTLQLAVPPLVREGRDTLSWQDPEQPRREPIRFQGIRLDSSGRQQGSSRPLLALPRRIEVPRVGRLTTTALDSGQTGFQWDRLTFDMTVPANARVIISTLTSEVEVPFERLATIPDERWSRPLVLLPDDVPEVLVQSGPGRFLWLHIELSGDGTSSPSIHEIDIYGPRRSSLRYLPVPFHEDPESKYFLDRFLSYFDTVFAEITARQRSMAELFDPRVVPQEFLAWLGKWFDLDFLATWPEVTRRQMIAEAIPYFRQRGTVAGLKRIVQWHCGLQDPLPQVIEHFRLPPIVAYFQSRDGLPVMIGGAQLELSSIAHSFTVVLPACRVSNDESRGVLERLIAASIPAHTDYKLRLLEPGVSIAQQSTIGVDTILGSAGGGALGRGRLGITVSTENVLPSGSIHLH